MFKAINYKIRFVSLMIPHYEKALLKPYFETFLNVRGISFQIVVPILGTSLVE